MAVKNNRELLFSLTSKDFRVETFCSGGPGGQHQNKTESGVRVTHIESGAVGESRDERSQHSNKKIAFERLVRSAKFKMWHSKKVLEITNGKRIEEDVDRAMNPKNLKVEVKDGKVWVPETIIEEVEE